MAGLPDNFKTFALGCIICTETSQFWIRAVSKAVFDQSPEF